MHIYFTNKVNFGRGIQFDRVGQYLRELSRKSESKLNTHQIIVGEWVLGEVNLYIYTCTFIHWQTQDS